MMNCGQNGVVDKETELRIDNITIRDIEILRKNSKDNLIDFEEYNYICKYDLQNNFEVIQKKASDIFQKNFYETQPKNIASVKMQIYGYQNKSQIINNVKKLIAQQPTLRMRYDESTQMMHEVIFDDEWSVPYFVADGKKENYFDALCNYVRLSCGLFTNGQLLSKIWVVKAEEDTHWMYLVAHHCNWDRMSSEILLSELRKQYGLSNQQVYIVPANLSGAKRIIDNFQELYKESLLKYQEVIRNCRYTGRFYLYENRDSQEGDFLLRNPLSYLMRKYQDLTLGNLSTKLKYIPLLVIYHGRTEKEKNLLGMYIDYLPAIYDVKNHIIIGGMDFVDNSYKRGEVYQKYAPEFPLDQMGPIINIRLMYNEVSIPTLDDKNGVQVVEYKQDDIAELDLTADFIGEIIQIGLPKIEIVT
jgi:hypothetical protein